ncbi:hypothetical protein J41TS12_37210 [Paenibacillus antibioticophila]|uniref:Uncharacterized protein n=1 Tax=Paenibacillus antibioticophila TaxID=1274374 RepID=A0A920CGM6_9BACL|nr:hypothetical protein [Paenibacillus antibioticophila]GIO38860.1 hypothetical protein J41TS12_37210 [Paenibacillus antibioticophila]
MTQKGLFKRLQDEGIPEASYSHEGGLPNERLCVEWKNNLWYVYYSERGIRTSEKDFLIEEIACQYFYQEIIRMVK